jgi:general stress protein YciG
MARRVLTAKSFRKAKFRRRLRAAAHDLRRTGVLVVHVVWSMLLAVVGCWGIRESAVEKDPNLMEARCRERGRASGGSHRWMREIASKGGRAAHAKGTAHEWTSDEARVAGRKGGEVVSRDRAHMAAIGREGGESRGAKNRRRQNASRGLEGTAAGVGASGAAYSDRESPVEISREGMSPQEIGSNRNLRDEQDVESVRDEDVPNPT